MRAFALLLTISLGFFVNSNGQSSDPVTYLETIGNEFQGVSREMMSYTSAAAHGKNAKKVEKKRQELLLRVQEAERNVRRLKPFESDASLRDSVVAYFDVSHSVLAEDFDKIIDMEEVAEQSYDAMEAYMLAKEKASEKLDEAYKKVDRQQDAFVEQHGIKLLQNTSKLNQKLETSGKVINYYNRIYLVFFKSYKDEAYLMEALSKADVNAKEQTKNALLNSATQGLSSLGSILPFSGDATLKVSCQQLLNFYKQEASASIPLMIEFDLKKENFEKIKKAMDAKRPADRTQEDVDVFNKAVKEFNESVNKVNSVTHELNKKRSQAIDQWNKVSNQFLDKHIPKYSG